MKARLIDAVALVRQLNEEWFDSWPIKEIRKTINEQPTVDPVKRGKWIHDDFGWHCSECWGMYPEEITDELNYCPNCGAQMV